MITAGEILEKEYRALPLSRPHSYLLGRFAHSGSILMSGFPGGGKSTLALQLLDDIKQHGNVLYVPAEEGADSFTTQEKIKRQPGKIRLTQNGLDHAQKHKTN